MRLVSYNIHSGIGTDRRFDLERVGAVLAELSADVVALQEVGDYRGRTSREAHPEYLAELLGMKMAFGPNVVQNERRYGNAILSRFPIVKSKNYDLSIGNREPRGALRCDLDLGNQGLFHVFCVHLGLSVSERRKQESLLLSADILRQAVRTDPVVVCGDFNYWGNGPMHALVHRAIHDAALRLRSTSRTYPSRFPIFRLDRIYVDTLVTPVRIFPHRSAAALVASDHLPLVLEMELALAAERQLAPPVELSG